MKATILLLPFLLGACAGGAKYDDEKLDKFPKCYHANVKIYQKCIKKNEAGDPVTALELENTAYPGQYK